MSTERPARAPDRRGRIRVGLEGVDEGVDEEVVRLDMARVWCPGWGGMCGGRGCARWA